jgi:hypothetical protein
MPPPTLNSQGSTEAGSTIWSIRCMAGHKQAVVGCMYQDKSVDQACVLRVWAPLARDATASCHWHGVTSRKLRTRCLWRAKQSGESHTLCTVQHKNTRHALTTGGFHCCGDESRSAHWLKYGSPLTAELSGPPCSQRS